MSEFILDKHLERHELNLRNLIERADIPDSRLRDAMLYSLFPGGKRLRPTLVYLCGALLEINFSCLDVIAAAVELVHSYSLIHDDLPAMDNDDMRRGKASCHRAFDEATAILAGDGMQALAVEILLRELPNYLSAPKVIAVTQALVSACGPSGMVSGQGLDLSELKNSTIEEPGLRQIHQLKTGKMISACIEMVLAADNPPDSTVNTLRQFGENLGLLFQMQDDYLDQYHSKLLGKGRASDSENQKTTYASLYNQEELRAVILALHKKTAQLLSIFGDRASHLLALIETLYLRLEEDPAATELCR